MSRVAGAGNKSTELTLLKFLRRTGITGWRRKYPLPGKPDFVFPAKRVAVFVDGCFWHGCPSHYRRPKSRQEFWDAKIKANMARDHLVRQQLVARGWTVLRVWEHEFRRDNIEALNARLQGNLSAD